MRRLYTVFKVLGARFHLQLLVVAITLTWPTLAVEGLMEPLYTLVDVSAKPAGLNAIAVTSYALAPFTSTVSVRAVEELLKGRGLHCSVEPVTLVPALVNGSQAVLVRGVRVELLETIGYIVVEGSAFNDTCFTCAWLGAGLAREMGVKLGSIMVLYTPFTHMPVAVRVTGILVLPEPMNHEILVPLETGRELRGVSGDVVSIALVMLGRECTREEVARALGLNTTAGAELLAKAVLVIRRLGKGYAFKLYESASNLLAERIKVGRTVYTAAVLAAAVVLSATAYIAGQATASTVSRIASTLYEQGLSLRYVKAVLAALASLYVGASLALYQATVPALGLRLPAPLLNYPVEPVPSPLSAAVIGLATASLLSAGVASVSLREA